MPLIDDPRSHDVGGALRASSSDAETGLVPPTSRKTVDDLPIPLSVVNGRYRIEGVLGRGGMGVVYLAYDELLEHRVALKYLPASFAQDERRVAQFHNEVRLARQMAHPNVCRVYDIGDADGQLFLSMEYVDGRDLGHKLDASVGLREWEAVEVLRGVCAGLAAVHARGVLHRDLKPANVMISRSGTPKLMDFGIADTATQLAGGEYTAEGTLAYMAPEVLAGGHPSIQSDIYALGHVMYETFTGERLVSANALDKVRRQHLEAATKAASRLNTVVSPHLRDAVLCCLDPDPASRPASVQDVVVMLQTVLLDARIGRSRRLLQLVEQGVVIVPVLFALLLPQHLTFAGVALAAAFLVAIIDRRFPLGWTVDYKGHTIQVQNHSFLNERLYLDGRLVDRGRFGSQITLRATIETGGGAGERITAVTRAGFLAFSCRMVVQAFVPDAS